MERQFKIVVLRILSFTFLAQIVAILIAQRFYISPPAEEVYEPFGKTMEGAFANSLPLLATIFIFSLFLAMLVRLKKFDFIKAIVVGFLASSVFSMNLILLPTIFPNLFLLPLILSILLVVLVFLVAYAKSFSFLSSFMSLLIGSEAAGYFATVLQPPTVFVFPVLLAVYDVYAVFAGPLKK